MPGKEICINVERYDNFDYLKVEEDFHANNFSQWYPKELKKLVEYMKKNNLVIKPGTYSIHDSDKFEKVVKILKFEKKENDNN